MGLDLQDGELVVLVYAEQCVGAGHRRWLGDDEDAAELAESADYLTYVGTREELREWAARLDAGAKAAGAGRDLYQMRVARALRDAAQND